MPLSNTTVNFFGPAQNAANADEKLSILQNRDAMPDLAAQLSVLKVENHIADPIGALVGLNPPTEGVIPEGSSWIKEAYRAITGQENTSHNCYGNPPKGCAALWDNKIPQLQSVTKYKKPVDEEVK